MSKSYLGQLYASTYTILCGKHPRLRPWHFQWLDSVYIVRNLRRLLPRLQGRVLDVGCGEKPYGDMLTNASEHIGIDLAENPQVDYVIESSEQWPFADNTFDGVFATQVLEHVDDYEFIIDETLRVLKPGGRIIFTFPFLYNEHGAPADYQRFSSHKARSLFDQFTLDAVHTQGGIGSTLVTLLLNWVEATHNLNYATRLFKAVMLPLSLPLNLIFNVSAYLIDYLDHTESFYSNVIVCGHAPETSALPGPE